MYDACSRPRRHRDEVQRQFVPERSQRRRRQPQGHRATMRSKLAQTADGLHRLVLDARLGPLHPDRRDHARAHDLVRDGKLRYIGVSDAPAWKVAQANGISELSKWPRFIGLQIEYSLLQRTVEGELIPMAQELGLGVTPWSPLAHGVLSGKF